jgi:hypothetical protein
MNFSQIPVDEYWAFGIYYCPSLVGCGLAIAVLWALVFHPRQQGKGRLSPILLSSLLLIPLLIWLYYFTVTAKYAFAITSLDAENNVFADVVYNELFDVNLNTAIKIAIDDKLGGNVRFYASCRIADILAANDDYIRAVTFQKVANAHEFRTGFGGTNELTCGFFRPNYAEGPFTVSKIIETRLRLKWRSAEVKSNTNTPTMVPLVRMEIKHSGASEK